MSLYEKDLVAWSDRTAALLREHNFDELDVDNLADEIEDMGENRRRALESRLTVLLTHLLKWQFQRISIKYGCRLGAFFKRRSSAILCATIVVFQLRVRRSGSRRFIATQ